MKILLFTFITTLCLTLTIFDNNCMEQGALDTSEIKPPITPNVRGLGFFWTLSTLTTAKRDKFLYDLKNDLIDVNNQSYHNIFNSSINEFVDYNEYTKLVEAIILVYSKFTIMLLPLNNECTNAHTYLTNIKMEKQNKLKETLSSYHKTITIEVNKRIDNLKSLFANALDDIDQYLKDEEKPVNAACNEIRDIKKALLLLHTMNGKFRLSCSGNDGYCSDFDETKAVKEHDSVASSYNNAVLFGKINMHSTHTSTMNNISINTQSLQTIAKSLYKVPRLTYDNYTPVIICHNVQQSTNEKK